MECVDNIEEFITSGDTKSKYGRDEDDDTERVRLDGLLCACSRWIV